MTGYDRSYKMCYLFCLCLPFLLLACPQKDKPKTDTSESRKAAVVPVRVLVIQKKGRIREYLFGNSTIEAREIVELYPKKNGYIKAVLKDEGDTVSAGDTLARLDDREAALQVRESELMIEEIAQRERKARLSIRELSNKLEQDDLTIREIETALREAQLAVRHHREDSSSKEKMLKNNLISKEDFDQAKYEYDRAVIRENSSRTQLEKTRKSREASVLAMERARLDMEALALERKKLKAVTLEQARLAWQDCFLQAPFNGLVTLRSVQLGQLVGPSNKLFTLMNPASLLVYLHIPEKELERVRTGQSVILSSDYLPDIKMAGKIQAVSPVIDPLHGTIKLTIVLTEQHPDIKAGMYVKVRIETRSRDNAILIPKRSIVYEREKPVVYTVKAGKAQKVPIRIGLRESDTVEVSQGLALGDTLIVEGQKTLIDGIRVKVVKGEEQP